MRFSQLVLFILLATACSGRAAETAPVPTASPPEQAAAPASTPPSPSPTATLPPAPLTTAAPAATETSTTAPTAQSAAAMPDPAGYSWQPFAAGLDRPIGLAHAGDGSGRLFVLEQPGRIRIVQDAQVLPEPFLDLTDRVGSAGSEQGLLGLAFHPRYVENGFFFVNYTDLQGDTVIARFAVSPDDPNRAEPGSQTGLLFIPQPYRNHNGGVVAFGPDGYLYLGLGDGGSAGDPQENGQARDTLLGKILRLDVDGGEPYAIPPGNPFTAGGEQPEVWAYGLRNPWRFAFDRLTGDLYIGDVGQGSFEEVNFQPAGSPGGENYGWNVMEGTSCFAAPDCAPDQYVLPIFTYPTHSEGTCAITGGNIYRGQELPEWQGVYLFGDYCSGQVWGLLRDPQGNWQNARLFENVARITSFGEDEAGEIYLADHAGAIYRLSKK